MKHSLVILAALFMLSLIVACENSYTPKPRGYYRIIFPQHDYKAYNPEFCPFSFEYPSYARLVKDTAYFDARPENPCWMTLVFPEFNADIYLSYKEINAEHNLARLIEDAHTLTYKHTVKANFIDEGQISTPNNVSGLYYEVGGNAASNIQFFLTDSTKHFIRGSLYFNNVPNADSLKPVIQFIKDDINHLIGTLKWKD